MSSALKQGVQAQLEKHSRVEPQWNWAVVFDTMWTGPLPPGSEWDYDMFLTRSAAEGQLRQPQTDRFQDPELWQRRNGTWEEVPVAAVPAGTTETEKGSAQAAPVKEDEGP